MKIHDQTPFSGLVKSRRSVRKFREEKVPREVLLMCAEAARLAPSADNSQPWRFLIVDDPDKINSIGKKIFSGIYRHTKWALKAPVLVFILADLDFVAHRLGGNFQRIPFYLIDVGIAGEHFVLQAQDLGLGTCWIGWFHFKKAKQLLKIPRRYKICDILAVGYPIEGNRKRPVKRKNLDNIACFNEWTI